jgi:hypothetical protein
VRRIAYRSIANRNAARWVQKRVSFVSLRFDSLVPESCRKTGKREEGRGKSKNKGRGKREEDNAREEKEKADARTTTYRCSL